MIPFLLPYTTAFGAVPFDEIKIEHYLPAVQAGIKEQENEVALIVENTEAPTFENTIEALERSGRTLDKVLGVFYNLLECDGTNEMMQLSEEIQPLVSDHATNIMLNEGLFNRIRVVWDNRSNLSLDNEQQVLLRETYESYLRNGATLEGEARDEWRRINAQLDSLTLTFGQNVLRATQSYSLLLTDSAELAGLPDFVVDAMQDAARKSNQEGWLLTLQAPSYRPFMTYSARRDLRETLYKAYATRAVGGEFDNSTIIRQITSLRLEQAKLLERSSFAEYRLENKMAKQVSTVNGLLNQLLEAYTPSARQDVTDVAQYAAEYERKQGRTDLLQNDGSFDLRAWDFMYYSNLLKKERFAIDDELLKPYFPLTQVKDGIFGLAGKLYGLTFEECDTLPKYHPEVETYIVRNADQSYLGLLYIDLFPRATKRAGAWMTSFQEQWVEADGTEVRPHVSIVCSFTPPTADRPSLLTFDEAETFLHEFGHALHGLLTKCRYSSLSGTNVAHDFVELPSQFMENYLGNKEFLHSFARHYQTGEAIPDALIERVRKAATFQAGYACLRQLTFGMLDMAYHTIEAPIADQPGATDQQVIADFERQAVAATQLLPEVPGTLIGNSFSHIFAGGYAAGYYGYKWSEVLDADAFAVFEQHGIYDPVTAGKFRKLLESGKTVDASELYRQFKGSDYTIEALMRRDGIIK